MIKERNQKRRPVQNDNDKPIEKRSRTDEDEWKRVVQRGEIPEKRKENGRDQQETPGNMKRDSTRKYHRTKGGHL